MGKSQEKTSLFLCFALRGKTLFFRLCGWLLGIMIVFLTLTFMSITYHRNPQKSRKTFNCFFALSYCLNYRNVILLFSCTILPRGGPLRAKPLITRRLPDETTSFASLPFNGKRVKFQVGDWHRPNPRGVASSTDDCGVVG